MLTLPRRPGAPRISAARAKAIALRLYVLENMEWGVKLDMLYRGKTLFTSSYVERHDYYAKALLSFTAKAVRRGT
ncbi:MULTISPECIES: hypothetical protein [unclassified Synechococcus]|uniref:hypothetical protein n=1 Tax=unclassified Synechococcus TaxID=2626047 RepID=UPI0021A3FCB0|nr:MULTISPECIES: hypothetical protein [unclassified Synechococcus]MCT0212445.1 hypothetical protein [Synechococcus sp. CS-1326]MCT0234628.1 hypothetical protein [Synechococcus sp. CS-1327]